jgi:hypothetical protein
MEEDVKALIDVSSRIICIFPKEGLEKAGEAETIEDKNPGYRNNEKILYNDYIFFTYSCWQCICFRFQL